MTLSRRTLLRSAGALGLTGLLSSLPARAADTGGYKALICLFLYGGMDNYDTLLPFDDASWEEYERFREPLLTTYRDLGRSRDRPDLLPLTPGNAASFGGRQFALPQELAPLHTAFESGNAAIVGNVGPLVVPTTRAQFLEEASSLPPRLFSHNDQQSVWMSSQPEGARFGWGGRFADAALNSGANTNPLFTAMSPSGNSVWLSGDVARQFPIDISGPSNLNALQWPGYFGSNADGLVELLEDHFRQQGILPDLYLQQDIIGAMQRSLDANARYAEAREAANPIATDFGEDHVSQQFRAVAEMISLRHLLGASRQVFLVSAGGYDTHDTQAQDLPGLQAEIANGIASFMTAMQEIGADNDVTVFTASDFGRTLTVNGDGTDHGWGAHHFVVGGAVNGGQIYGDPGLFTPEHDQDAGQGRLIPTTSVEQFAAPLGRWFGLSESELNAALPGLRNFTGSPGFV